MVTKQGTSRRETQVQEFLDNSRNTELLDKCNVINVQQEKKYGKIFCKNVRFM